MTNGWLTADQFRKKFQLDPLFRGLVFQIILKAKGLINSNAKQLYKQPTVVFIAKNKRSYIIEIPTIELMAECN